MFSRCVLGESSIGPNIGENSQAGEGLRGSISDFRNMISGQIIATSHDLTPNGGLVREIPLFQGNLGW